MLNGIEVNNPSRNKRKCNITVHRQSRLASSLCEMIEFPPSLPFSFAALLLFSSPFHSHFSPCFLLPSSLTSSPHTLFLSSFELLLLLLPSPPFPALLLELLLKPFLEGWASCLGRYGFQQPIFMRQDSELGPKQEGKRKRSGVGQLLRWKRRWGTQSLRAERSAYLLGVGLGGQPALLLGARLVLRGWPEPGDRAGSQCGLLPLPPPLPYRIPVPGPCFLSLLPLFLSWSYA